VTGWTIIRPSSSIKVTIVPFLIPNRRRRRAGMTSCPLVVTTLVSIFTGHLLCWLYYQRDDSKSICFCLTWSRKLDDRYGFAALRERPPPAQNALPSRTPHIAPSDAKNPHRRARSDKLRADGREHRGTRTLGALRAEAGEIPQTSTPRPRRTARGNEAADPRKPGLARGARGQGWRRPGSLSAQARDLRCPGNAAHDIMSPLR
jgi:hypothetical protein